MSNKILFLVEKIVCKLPTFSEPSQSTCSGCFVNDLLLHQLGHFCERENSNVGWKLILSIMFEYHVDRGLVVEHGQRDLPVACKQRKIVYIIAFKTSISPPSLPPTVPYSIRV